MTVIGRIFGAVIALLGIGVVVIPTGIISSGLMERISGDKAEQEQEDQFKYCPHCGKRIRA